MQNNPVIRWVAASLISPSGSRDRKTRLHHPVTLLDCRVGVLG
ncbi:hypothetical protein [Paremcibacter congregatus]